MGLGLMALPCTFSQGHRLYSMLSSVDTQILAEDAGGLTHVHPSMPSPWHEEGLKPLLVPSPLARLPVTPYSLGKRFL